MKRALVVVGLLLLSLSGLSANPGGVSFGVFYSSLSPHGEWIQCDGGVYAWRPVAAAPGWRPYFNGRWCWTDDGWYWASDEPWAWATYHYGRWHYDDFYGWVWIPGYDWAPAWVEWRYGGDCIGWAPLSPYAVFSVHFGIHYRSYWITPHSWWSFVDCRYIADPYIHRYVYRPENNTRYIGRTRSAGSVRYDGGRVITRGPDREYVERKGNVRLERAEIRDVADRSVDRIVRDGGRERVEVYRPKIDTRDDAAADIRPDRVRKSDRSIALDARGIDARSRDIDRETGRDVRRADEFRKRDDGRIQSEPRGDARQRDGDRRGDSPVYNQRDRKEEQRDVRRGGEVERRPEKQVEPRRRDDSRSSQPEIRSRRPETPNVDRSPSPRHEPQQGGRGGDSGSRGGGRKR